MADRTSQETNRQVNDCGGYFDQIRRAQADGEKIELRGFGSFRIRHRGSRIGRNPKTGAMVEVPPKRIPYFKPGKELKELLNNDS